MEKYILDCEVYTEDCFCAVLDLVELCQGVEVVEVNIKNQKAIIKATKQSFRIIKRVVEMSDIAEIYENRE